MLDRTERRFGLKPKRLAADTAYGTGRFLGMVSSATDAWTAAADAVSRRNFPFIKNGEIPSKHFCELVRAAEKVGYRRGVPARASRGPDAAFVERPRDRFERCCASTRLNVLV